MGMKPELHFVTPEREPLEVFQVRVRDLLDLGGITLHTSTTWRPGLLDVERVVTLPVLEGPAIQGLPSDEHGFLVTDPHGRVVPGVFAAGDVTNFEIKQGGLACQMADAAAEQIAADAGAPVLPQPFKPELQGLLLTDHWARYLRPGGGGPVLATRGLRWPPAKIAGRELARYLKTLEPAAVARS
jgi:sulfide:quinone oxidoreductase